MNLLCFLKHLLERRIARRREARRSDRLQRRPRSSRMDAPGSAQIRAKHPSKDVYGGMISKIPACKSNSRTARSTAR